MARPASPRTAAPARTLVVVAGLPGAGTSTLQQPVRGRHPAQRRGDVLGVERPDAGRVRGPALRPLVHGAHLVRVVRACWSDATCVATTDLLTSRARHVLLHVSPLQARDGQRRRGRRLSDRRMRRHERRSARRWGASRVGEAHRVLTREQAARVHDLADVLSARQPQAA